MKRKITSLLAAVLLACGLTFVGCSGGCTTSQQRQSVNTLFSVGETVDASYRAYLDLVVAGKLGTNEVPKVAQSYQTFQAAFNAATILVANSTNAPPPQSVLDAAAGVTASINQAKGK